jgi:hypothetical protein
MFFSLYNYVLSLFLRLNSTDMMQESHRLSSSDSVSCLQFDAPCMRWSESLCITLHHRIPIHYMSSSIYLFSGVNDGIGEWSIIRTTGLELMSAYASLELVINFIARRH